MMKSCDDNGWTRESGEREGKQMRANEGAERIQTVISDIHSLCFWHWTHKRGQEHKEDKLRVEIWALIQLQSL